MYGQYVYLDKRYGLLVQIYDLITKDEVTIDQILKASLLFPLIIVGLKAAIREGIWKVIGNATTNNFRYPLFKSTVLGNLFPKPKMWYLWDGSELVRVGYQLPEEYNELEYLVVWTPDAYRNRRNPLDTWIDLQ